MSSPPKKKRKKPSEKGKKRNKAANASTRSGKKKSTKRGPNRQWAWEQKEFRDGLIDSAARQIIDARDNNPKNKPGEKRKVPHGLYPKKVEAINRLAPGLDVTVNDIENKVRSIDKKNAAEASSSSQPTVSSTAAISNSKTEPISGNADAPIAVVTHPPSKIPPSDSNTPSDSDVSPAPRRLESALNAAVSQSDSIPPPPLPPPPLPPPPLPHTESPPTIDPLPSSPLGCSFLMDSSQRVTPSQIVQLSWLMREEPRREKENPRRKKEDSEYFRHLAGEIVIQHPTDPLLAITQENYSRLQPGVWICDGTINFVCQGILQQETNGMYFFSTHLISTLLHDEDMQFPSPQPVESYIDGDDIMGIWEGKAGGNEAFYDFSRVQRWHVKAAEACGVDSIFDLRMLFIPINKDGIHWIFIMVDIESEEIGLWDDFGVNSDNNVFLTTTRKYLYDVHKALNGEDETGAYDDWTKRWSIVDHSNDWPRQTDGHSCGLFTLLGLYHLAHELELKVDTFSQQDIYDWNVRMKLALLLYSYRNGMEAPTMPTASIPASLIAQPSIALVPASSTTVPPASAATAPPTTAPPTTEPPTQPNPSSRSHPSIDSSATATASSSSKPPRNMGGRPVGTTKKNASEKEKAVIEARTFVVVEYAEAQSKAKQLGTRVARGTRDRLVEQAKELFDVPDDFDVASSTIDSRIKAGNLEVIKPGEKPIVLALEPIMVALILTSSVSGKPLRVREAIALCNEVLQSHDEMKAKVIAWKQGRGIHNPNGWLLGYAWWKGFCLRNDGIMDTTVSKKFAKNRASHCVYPAFRKMYDVFEDGLMKSGNVERLDNPVHMDGDGNIVRSEYALGWGVTHRYIRPENVFVFDETGGNTNGKSDSRNGGERVVGPKGETAPDIAGPVDAHFTVTPIADMTGELRLVQIIFKGEKVPEYVPLGLDPLKTLVGDGSVKQNMGPGKRYPGCNLINDEGKPVPVMFDCSENASQTGETLLNLFKTLDRIQVGSRGVDKNGRSFFPACILDGHTSRFYSECLKYWNDGSHRWMVMLGAPYGTSLWQAHDTSGQNGNFKQKLYDLMRQLMVMKGAEQLPQEIRPAEVLPLVEGAADVSFNRVDRVRRALATVGANPLNRNRLDHVTILRTAPKDVQEARQHVLSRRRVHGNNSATVSGMQANLLTEGSGYLLGGGNEAKSKAAVEAAASGLNLKGCHADQICDDLRTLYSKQPRLSANTVFGKGDGLLQEEVRDEAIRREQTRKDELDAKERKKKKALWELAVNVDRVRNEIATKFADHFRRKGFSEEDEVKESDLEEDQIRKLSGNQLKTLVKWKKGSKDKAIPSRKAELAVRLIDTMDRRSPHASPYNSDEEDDEEENDGVVASAVVGDNVGGEEEEEEEDNAGGGGEEGKDNT